SSCPIASMRSLVSSAYGNFRFIGSGMKIVCNFESLPYGVDTVASEVGLQFLTTGHLSLKSGFPNKDGINSSRNKSNCALAPTDRPASLFNGTTAFCRYLPTDHDIRQPRIHRRNSLLPSGRVERKLDQRYKLV